MPRYIAFQTGYVDRILSEDEKTCTLDNIPNYRVPLVMGYCGHEYCFVCDEDDKEALEDIVENVPSGSIVFERVDGQDISFEAIMLYSRLKDENFCCIYDLGEIKEFEDVIVVECCSESG